MSKRFLEQFGRLRFILVLFAFGPLTALAPQSPAPAALDSAELPAAGRHSTYLTVNSFGRFALSVQSESGTGLQLVDRMAGPGPLLGVAGGEDGRLDAFLDRGRYKLIIRGDDQAQGNVRLQAQAFEELNADPVQLVELKAVEAQLGDLEQVSYWIEVNRLRPVVFEAAGRNLADLRLWKDGAWLVDAAPSLEVVQPRPGKPLQICRLSISLNPGLYRLTAYGGPSQPWAQESEEHPFHLRWGIPQRPEAARSSHQISPWGIDRWMVPGSANFVRLEIPEAQPLTMSISQPVAEDPFSEAGSFLEITRESVPPAVETTLSPSRRSRLITVRGQAGQPYLLQHFLTKPFFLMEGNGSRWLSTVHSGAIGDSIDVTGVLVRNTRRSQNEPPLAVQAVQVGPSQSWRRRFNLLQRTTLHVQVNQPGAYRANADGVAAEVRFEPFFVNPPRDYEAPPFQPAGTQWQLERGLYVLSIVPRQKGIVTLTVGPASGLGASEPASAPVKGSFRIEPFRMQERDSYSLYLNLQPGVASGLVLRPLPLDLTQSLPLTQLPGEEISLSIQAGSRQQVQAETESGESVSISVNDGAWVDQATLEAGQYRLKVRNDSDRTVAFTLRAVPVSLLEATPLPDLPRGRLESIRLPALSPLEASYFDLKRNQRRSYRVEVPQAGLYRLESTGLLHTQGNLRTRTIPALFQESANGAGRNFLIQQYLGAGDYQITVQAQGRSMGHLGLHLELGETLDGGPLAEGLAARSTLPAGQALIYSLDIAEEGHYCLSSLGLGRMHRFRLEGEDGFPLLAAEHRQPVCHAFEVGRYRMILLPEALETRRVTLLERSLEPLQLTGKGPHRLPIDSPVEKLWMEPEQGQPRLPDVWEFNLPAEVEARLVIEGEMQGQLFRAGQDYPLAAVPPSRGWSGTLQAGAYRLEVTALRPNNRMPYRVALHPSAMIVGMRKNVSAPASIPLSLGPHPSVEISSLGSWDVSARLYDAAGNLVAQGDDRPDDWNFHILRSLAEGRYTLQVDPVAVEEASCQISLDVSETVQEEALRLPARRRLELGRQTRLFPLSWPSRAELLLVRAESPQGMGLALEADGKQGWKVLLESQGRTARLEIPLPAERSSDYRLRLWSLDGRSHSVELQAQAVRPRPQQEAVLAAGAPWRPIEGFPAAALAFDLKEAGLFEFPQPPEGFLFCPRLGAPCRPAQDPSPVSGQRLWLVSDSASGTIRGRRVGLNSDAETALKLSPDWPVRIDLGAEGAGPVVVLAQSAGGQPGIGLASAGGSAQPSLSALQMAVDEGAAVTVSARGGIAAAWLWAAQPAQQELDVRLKRWDFASPPSESLPWGQRSELLQGNSVRGFVLPPGSKRLRLVLGKGVLAALSQGQGVSSVHWRKGDSYSETLQTQSDSLLLINLEAAPSPASLELFPTPDDRPLEVLSVQNPLERSFSSSGVLRLGVLPDPNRPSQARIRLQGAREDALLLTAEGRVYRGRDLPAPPQGATLLVPHEPGWLLAFLDAEGKGSPVSWPQDLEEAETSLPRILSLQGAAQSWRFQLAEPSLVELRTSSPLVLRWGTAQGDYAVELLPQGGNPRRFLPAGTNHLSLRALGGGQLDGSAELLSSSVEPIGEGLGPERLLAPGATRLFSFQVRRPGPVGIGVRADPDVVQARLLDSQGKALTEGVVEMIRLEPATYLLSLTAPPDGLPVSVRPAVVGLDLPPDDPPREVIERYLQTAADSQQ